MGGGEDRLPPQRGQPVAGALRRSARASGADPGAAVWQDQSQRQQWSAIRLRSNLINKSVHRGPSLRYGTVLFGRGKYHDIDVGPVPGFDYGKQELIDLTAEINNNHLAFSVGSVTHKILLSDMPYVYSAGKVRVSIAACRVRIQEIELTPLSSGGDRN